ncbi:hypothetical protein [Natronococcus jeotgali]|nr:hypothetical protein [Natronococcus jeotgali]
MDERIKGDIRHGQPCLIRRKDRDESRKELTYFYTPRSYGMFAGWLQRGYMRKDEAIAVGTALCPPDEVEQIIPLAPVPDAATSQTGPTHIDGRKDRAQRTLERNVQDLITEHLDEIRRTAERSTFTYKQVLEQYLETLDDRTQYHLAAGDPE